ncbi:MAG: hypothetical protein AABW79_04845 [Nanoarchaeota archaeon]
MRINRFNEDEDYIEYDPEEEIGKILEGARPSIWTETEPEGLNRARLYRDSRNTTYR